jgi:hypothetical protein
LAQQAVANGKRFSVYVTEARPDSHGELTVKKLRDEGIQATLLLDAAVGAVMERIDIVLVGAEGMCHACAISSSAPPAPSPPRLKSQSRLSPTIASADTRIMRCTFPSALLWP